MMVAPVDQRDADRRAGQPVRRFQPAEAGTDDHHAMGFYGSRLRFGHGLAAFGFRFLRAWYVSVWMPRSKAGFPSPVFQGRFANRSIAKTYRSTAPGSARLFDVRHSAAPA